MVVDIFIAMFQSFNVLRYEIGQRYNSHYDAFNPQEYGPQKSQRVNVYMAESFIILILDHSSDIPHCA